jgi:hypothetical protein
MIRNPLVRDVTKKPDIIELSCIHHIDYILGPDLTVLKICTLCGDKEIIKVDYDTWLSASMSLTRREGWTP